MGPVVLLLLSGLITATLAKPGFLSTPSFIATLTAGAPLGPDGRVVDTPDVRVAKAEHAAAQVNERIGLADEAARSAAADLNGQLVPAVANGIIGPVAAVGLDGRLLDTPEVAAAKTAHALAQINERINLANEAARTSPLTFPLLAGNALLVHGAPIGPDGRVQDTPEVAVAKAAHATAHLNEKLNLATESAKSADVLAVAGPALAYGRLVY